LKLLSLPSDFHWLNDTNVGGSFLPNILLSKLANCSHSRLARAFFLVIYDMVNILVGKCHVLVKEWVSLVLWPNSNQNLLSFLVSWKPFKIRNKHKHDYYNGKSRQGMTGAAWYFWLILG
jgi:hypothetical protein